MWSTVLKQFWGTASVSNLHFLKKSSVPLVEPAANHLPVNNAFLCLPAVNCKHEARIYLRTLKEETLPVNMTCAVVLPAEYTMCISLKALKITFLPQK